MNVTESFIPWSGLLISFMQKKKNKKNTELLIEVLLMQSFDRIFQLCFQNVSRLNLLKIYLRWKMSFQESPFFTQISASFQKNITPWVAMSFNKAIVYIARARF